MKNIGIITLYWGNYNNGGVLQAFALQKCISELGVCSYQVAFRRSSICQKLKRLKTLSVSESYSKFMAQRRFRNFIKENQLCESIQKRKNNYREFIFHIPHTKLYTTQSIKAVNEMADILICGSDQIWNPGWWCKEYFLGFTKLPKISYAASCGVNTFTESQKKYMERCLKDFRAISVRETSLQHTLQEITQQAVEWVLDPTMLIGKHKWEKEERYYKTPSQYAFLYSLGGDTQYKKDIYEYCHNHNIVLINVPHVQMKYVDYDEKFSDIKAYDAGPREWLYLLHHANVVFTDSFHGTVFSLIFNKQFLCFRKNADTDRKSENSRLEDLLNMFCLKDRIVTKIPAELTEINYERIEEVLQKHIDSSIQFLKRNIYYD